MIVRMRKGGRRENEGRDSNVASAALSCRGLKKKSSGDLERVYKLKTEMVFLKLFCNVSQREDVKEGSL
jgi:hypothetical protein